MPRRDAFDVKRSLFCGKRCADVEVDASPVHVVKKLRDCVVDTGANKGWEFTSDAKESSDIQTAVETFEAGNGVIADGSRDCTLPTIAGKHRDLKSISPEVMADVVRGHFNDVLSDVTIVDCRYPYEFEGGHIRGAVNLYTKDDVNTLLTTPVSDDKRHVLIFHCEFSSERGPKM